MIFDCHSDVLCDVTTRRLAGEKNTLKKHLIDFKMGKVDGAIFVIWIDPSVPHDKHLERSYDIMRCANEEFIECVNELQKVTDYEGMMKAYNEGKFFAFIGLEGLNSIGEDLSLIDKFYDFGARHASLTWNEENPLATGVKGTAKRGLTEIGKAAVQKIIDKKMLLDVSHANEKTFWDIIEIAKANNAPVMASHSNCKAICDVPRNLTDEQLKAIAQSGGFVGINSYNEFVDKDVKLQDVSHLIDHLEHMIKIMGIDCVGFGFDYCDYLDDSSMAGFKSQETTATIGLEDSSKTPNVIDELIKRGYSKEDIEKIASGNIIKFIQKTFSSSLK